jgi:hypothetical protein
MPDVERSTTDVGATLEREAELIVSAMRLVAAGFASRSIVAGLGMTDSALAIVAGQAASLGVVVEAIARPDRQGRDVLVRRGTPA